MGKHTDGGWLKEDDPIFTEGITGFTVRKVDSGEERAEPRVLAGIRKGESKEEFKERIKGALREAGILKDKKEGE